MTRSGRRNRGARYPFTIDRMDERGRWGQQAGRSTLVDAKEYIKAIAGATPATSWRVRHGSRSVYQVEQHGHKHVYSTLWSHYGPFGRQDVHFHPCIEGDADCDHVLEADGRNCDGNRETHRVVDLDAR